MLNVCTNHGPDWHNEFHNDIRVTSHDVSNHRQLERSFNNEKGQ